MLITLQVGGQKALVSSNPLNSVENPAPVIPGQFGATGIVWVLAANGIVSTEVSGVEGDHCKFTAIAPGTVAGQIQGHSLSNVLVTYDFTVVVEPPPVNELTHFAPTVEFVD